MKQLGGMGNIMEMVKGLQEGGGMGGMEEMMSKMMGGAGGAGGGMGNMMEMAQKMMAGGGMPTGMKMPPGMPKSMMKMGKAKKLKC